ENLVRDLAGGALIAQQRTVVLVGGAGTGKTHLAIAIIRPLRSVCRGSRTIRLLSGSRPYRCKIAPNSDPTRHQCQVFDILTESSFETGVAVGSEAKFSGIT